MPDKIKKFWIKVKKSGTLHSIHPNQNIDKKRARKIGLRRATLSWHLPNKKGMGRNKGNVLERQTAKAFSTWLYGEENYNYMKRTPLSGGWASGKAGDIILDHEIVRTEEVEDYPLYVECRSYAKILQHDVLSWSYEGMPKTFTEWIYEVESKADGRMPFLVLKGKGTKPWVMLLRRWLTTRTKEAVQYASVVRLKKGFKTAYLFPMEVMGKLGEGGAFMKRWREDGGPTNIRRLGKHPD